MIGRIVDHVETLPTNWRSKNGVVHGIAVHKIYQEHEDVKDAIPDFWQTLCESHSWEEKAPKLGKQPVTCVLCLGTHET
jgi:hypothetical protein